MTNVTYSFSILVSNNYKGTVLNFTLSNQFGSRRHEQRHKDVRICQTQDNPLII